jgi:septal ring factor EnvC (AmiA/AmiB activator)
MPTPTSQSSKSKGQILGLALTILTLLGGIIYKYTTITTAVAANTKAISATSEKLETHIADPNNHITQREWSELMDRLNKIDDKLDNLQYRGAQSPRQNRQRDQALATEPVRPSRNSNSSKPLALPTKPKYSKDVVGGVKKVINKIKGKP